MPCVGHLSGSDGRRLTIADLPSPETKRWVIRRKAEVIAAVRGGLLSLEGACQRYKMDSEEFLSWQYCIERYGLAGLRTTRIQSYARVPLHVG
jgi:hypothetical protein